MTSFLHNTVVLHFSAKTVRGKTDSCHRLPFFPCSSALLVNSVPQYVPFLRALRGCSLCVSKLSRVLFTFTGTSLRELGHNMDRFTIAKNRSEVDRWLRKGFWSCGKSVAMTPAGAKNEHGRHNVPRALQADTQSVTLVIRCTMGGAKTELEATNQSVFTNQTST